MISQTIRNGNMSYDPVCHMEVLSEAAESNDLYCDFEGKKFVFCSLSCLQSFQMNPRRFIKQDSSTAEIGYCELCSKRIKEGEDSSELNFHGKQFRFCCSVCSMAFLKKGKSDNETEGSIFHEPQGINDPALIQWLEEAVKQNASDLFLSVGEKPMLKVYGIFRRLGDVSLNAEQLHQIIQKIIPEKNWSCFLEGNEVDMGVEIRGLSRFRMNVFQEQNGAAVAIRPIPQKIPTIEDLRLPAVFHDLSRLPRGLVLITGPAGSGKSTTLAALIDAINQREDRHIITIEDPIEYIIPSKNSLIHQREVGRHTSSFANGLRNALRENPDIIVIGELRDLESIALAVRAAETGHLVLGTLHSGTAIQAVTRLLDVLKQQGNLKFVFNWRSPFKPSARSA